MGVESNWLFSGTGGPCRVYMYNVLALTVHTQNCQCVPEKRGHLSTKAMQHSVRHNDNLLQLDSSIKVTV